MRRHIAFAVIRHYIFLKNEKASNCDNLRKCFLLFNSHFVFFLFPISSLTKIVSGYHQILTTKKKKKNPRHSVSLEFKITRNYYLFLWPKLLKVLDFVAWSLKTLKIPLIVIGWHYCPWLSKGLSMLCQNCFRAEIFRELLSY